MQLPMDPVMLLSVVNTQLRDNYDSLEALAEAADTTAEDLKKKLAVIGYRYNQTQNQFK